MNPDNLLMHIEPEYSPETPKRIGRNAKWVIIIAIVFLVIGVVWTLAMGYFGNVRASTLHDGAKELMYQCKYKSAKDRITDALELANTNFLISSDLKENIKKLDEKIDGYLFMDESKDALNNNNISKANALLNQALAYNADLQNEEKGYIDRLNTIKVDKANQTRIEEALGELMLKNNVKLKYNTLGDKQNFSDEVGVCGVASIDSITSDDYYINLITYDNENIIILVPSDFRNDEMYKDLKANGQLEVGLTIKSNASGIYSTRRTWHKARLTLDDILEKKPSNNSISTRPSLRPTLRLDEELTNLNNRDAPK